MLHDFCLSFYRALHCIGGIAVEMNFWFGQTPRRTELCIKIYDAILLYFFPSLANYVFTWRASEISLNGPQVDGAMDTEKGEESSVARSRGARSRAEIDTSHNTCV